MQTRTVWLDQCILTLNYNKTKYIPFTFHASNTYKIAESRTRQYELNVTIKCLRIVRYTTIKDLLLLTFKYEIESGRYIMMRFKYMLCMS